jgi:hypothetical protein
VAWPEDILKVIDKEEKQKEKWWEIKTISRIPVKTR